VHPFEILAAFGRAQVVVVREAADAGARGAGRHQAVRVRVVDDRRLAAAVRPHQRDELRVGRQGREVERELVPAEPVAYAGEALEGESKRFHAR
jgi:hypothetical protein